MKTAIILCCLLLAACSDVVFKNEIKADFKPYVKEFDTLYSGSMPNIVIKFGSVPAGKAATCTIDFIGQKTIKVDREVWDKSCEDTKRALIFHELGHCVLRREHTTSEMSYMFQSLRSCEFYAENEEILDYELFHPGDITIEKMRPYYTPNPDQILID